MPVAAAFQFSVPAPFAAGFPNGEQAIAVASPMASTPARTNFRLAKWFDFEGGVYTLLLASQSSVAMYASAANGNARFLASQSLATGVVSSTVYIPRGRFRLDLILANVEVAAATTFVAFSLSKKGRLVYVSGSSGWVFDTNPIADSDVPSIGDSRLALRVLTISPNWDTPITERFEFKTEIMASETETEQRRALRRYPRRSFEISYLRTSELRSRLQAFFTGIGEDEFLLPLWHEQFKLQASFGFTLTFEEGQAPKREFQPGTLALLIGSRPDQYDIVGVESINALTDTVSFSAIGVMSYTWPAGSRLVPLRKARISEAVSLLNPTDRVGTATVRFTLTEPDKWVVPTWLYCVPYFQFKINRATEIDTSFDRLTTVIDNDTGLVESFDRAERTRLTMRAGLMLRGRQSVYQFRQFVSQARGRQMKFWMPSHLQDLQPIADFSGMYFDVVKVGFAGYVRSPQEINRTVMIVFKTDRPPIFRFVTQITETLIAERVFVTVALPAIQLAAVERVSFVLPTRFDQEAFELQHLVDDCAVVTTSVILKSDEVGELPPIECAVTSRPYPIEDFEGLSISMAILNIAEIVVGYPAEAVSLSMAISEILQIAGPTFRQYNNYADEAISVALQITEGELLQLLQSYNNYPDEAIEVAMSLLAGQLTNLLISYSNYAPEAVEVSMTIVSGELT